jgi:hypothetical protein
MATLREYFDTDLKSMSVHADWEMRNSAGTTLPPVRARIFQDFDANAKYWSFFIPEGVDVVGYINSIFGLQETALCVLSSEGETVFVQMGLAEYSERASSETLIFTKRIHLYIDTLLNAEDRKQICELGARCGFQVLVRDKEYALKRSRLQQPLAFISHDSRDKDSLVRNLALELSKLMCPVWYDEYSLQVGDSLRTSIETGLKETQKCIVVLSPNFLSNSGWGKAEFDSVFTREILEKSNIFLPVWHNVGVHDVYQYSPRLADKVGLSSSLGVEELARKLANAIKQSGD